MATRVAVLTTTRYSNVEETRFGLAKEMMREVLEGGHDVFVMDSSPDPRVAEGLGELRLIPSAAFLLFRQKTEGMGAGRRELFRMAQLSGSSTFLWTEPEKRGTAALVSEIVAPIESGEADIVIVCRASASTLTYPRFQQISEAIADRVYMELTGLSGGPMHGPVAFSRDAARYFAECDPTALGFPEVPDTYIQHYAPFFAMRDGLRVVAVEVDFVYPPEQKAEEEGPKALEMVEKRLWQADTLTRAYFLLAKRLGLRSRT